MEQSGHMYEDRLLLHLLLHAGRLLENRVRESCAPAGVHHGQGRVLMALARQGPMTQGDIAARLGVRAATVTNMVKRMEACGLVSRSRHAQDERVQVVSLTPQGLAAQQAVRAAWAGIEADILEALPAARVEEAHALLRQIIEGLGGRLPKRPDSPAAQEDTL